LGCVCAGGAVSHGDDPLLIDRIDGWSQSVGALALRLARAGRADDAHRLARRVRR
jgi:hypothetical protein